MLDEETLFLLANSNNFVFGSASFALYRIISGVTHAEYKSTKPAKYKKNYRYKKV